MNSPIPFNQPYVAGNACEYVAQAARTGDISSDGEFTLACARLLEDAYGITKVFMTPSCTAALEMAAQICDLGPGDEVIMPSYTFVTTASAFVRTGATPVFVDIRHDTLNIDERCIEAAITPRTRAIVPVHYAGVGCEMDAIMDIASRHGLIVIEDAAQGVNASYKKQPLGSIGHLGCYSFHGTKNYACGEGGALCVNAPELIERAEIIRDKGTNRQKFFRGESDKYTWVDLGSSYVPSEISCALLLAQLELKDEIQQRRRDVYQSYLQQLEPTASMGAFDLPFIPAHCESNYHMFYLLSKNGDARDALLSHLKQCGIHATFHYVPLHDSPMGRKLVSRLQVLPITTRVSQQLIRLPLFCQLSRADIDRVVESINSNFTAASDIRRLKQA